MILGAGPAHALYFGTYEVVKDMTGGNREGHQWASTGECRASFPILTDRVSRTDIHSPPRTLSLCRSISDCGV